MTDFSKIEQEVEKVREELYGWSIWHDDAPPCETAADYLGLLLDVARSAEKVARPDHWNYDPQGEMDDLRKALTKLYG